MSLFGIEFTDVHVRILIAVLGGLFATFGFIAGHWAAHRRNVSFKREDLVTSLVVIELYGIRHEDGRDVLHIITQGGAHSLQEFFQSAELVQRVQRAAKRHPGLLKLSEPVAHRLMMDAGKDSLTGLDAKANMDYLHNRPVREDKTLFTFAAYAERDHDGDGVKDQAGRLVVMVVAPDLIERLADPAYVAALDVAHEGYRRRRQWLHDLALEWNRLQRLPLDDRSPATDRIWRITVRTSLT